MSQQQQQQQPEQQQKQKRQKTAINEYTGFIIDSSTQAVDTINTKDITAQHFFDEYIKPRKPVKIVGEGVVPLEKFKFDKILQTLGHDEKDKEDGENREEDEEEEEEDEEKLQVERLYDGGFGSGQKRVHMTMKELMEKLGDNTEESYYLTTQYKEHDIEGVDENQWVDSEDNEDEDEDGDEEENVDLEKEKEEDKGEPLDAGSELDGFSETDSINMNDLHDDYDDFDNLDDDDDDDKDDKELSPSTELCLEEALERVKELYQPPLSKLVNDATTLPLNPSFIPKLIPQQINLWMGKTKPLHKFHIDKSSKPLTHMDRLIPKGSSSGLHHDHADNLYILVQGRKRFTIYSPADALKLYTCGKIYKIFHNGMIDYEQGENGWMSIRDDGAIIEDVLRWKAEHQEEAEEEEEEEKREKELEKILAKSLEKESGKVHKSNGGEEQFGADSAKKEDPPSFSKVPPALLHLDEMDLETRIRVEQFAETYFPGVLELNKMEVWLDPGEMLYLPAGWFHEVSSFGSGSGSGSGNGSDEKSQTPGDDVHIALNYWFIPPNGDSFEKSYKDGYWSDDWKVTKEALELVQKEERKY